MSAEYKYKTRDSESETAGRGISTKMHAADREYSWLPTNSVGPNHNAPHWSTYNPVGTRPTWYPLQVHHKRQREDETWPLSPFFI
ncbi:Hypothetical predicted protein [Pelobates cultripes]|uniref:Uncharacterized protein n=1 Tax=Pelobates cultripes TaxID=61616 RepID=A0AAD1WJD0_PELCU|nr:Hypothetical predicted protein [Pelobates cultripes]